MLKSGHVDCLFRQEQFLHNQQSLSHDYENHTEFLSCTCFYNYPKNGNIQFPYKFSCEQVISICNDFTEQHMYAQCPHRQPGQKLYSLYFSNKLAL